MNRHKHDLQAADCDHERIDHFLNSADYHLDNLVLIEHLDQCESCREYIQHQAGAEDWWQKTSSLLKPTEFDQAGTQEFSAASSVLGSSRQPLVAKHVLEQLPPSEFPNHLGRLGTYEVTGVVGVGGMGVVLKAIDPSLDRVVAIKVMNPRLANSEKACKRFAREAKAAAAVLHPNVIPIHSVSSDGTSPYLVMAYIRGGSLQTRLQKDGPLPLIEVLRIGSQIAAGLAAAHDQGLVHRDIKPENILLEEGVERVTITDFGLARAVDDNTITQQGTIAGTPMYMSPEQARGEQLDQTSDLFSLGSVLYALCAGRPPFRSDSSYGVMRQIIDDQPQPLREINPAIPEWFVNIVRKLMAREKADRFASADEVHKLLEACLSHVQQPQGYQLPDIPNPFPKSVQSTTKRVPLMIKFAAGMITMAILAMVVLPFARVQWTTLVASDDSGHEDPTLNMKPMQDVGFGVNELTVELAERLTGTKEAVTFGKVTSLEPEVAAVLARHPGNLSLPAINQLTPEVAKALVSDSKNIWLGLDGLKEITPEVASELAASKCAMRLGMETMTPEVAEILATRPGSLALGLKSISPDVAEKLAMYKAWIQLGSLTTIDAESAAQLAKHKDWLSLNGLESLTPEVAKALGSFDGGTLDLNGLKTLDLEIAKELANAKCSLGLYLNGLTEISPEVINVLANGNSGLSFQGLEFDDASVEQAFLAAEKKLEAAGRVLLRREPAPWLRLVSHRQEGAAAKGETWSLVWNLRANLVGNVEVQALHIKGGKSHVVSEVKCPVDGQRLIDVQLQLKSLDEPLTSKGNVFAPSLSIILDGIATKSIETEKLTWIGDFAVYSLSMSGMPSVSSKNLFLQAANVPIVVTPDRLEDSIDDMVKASKKGDDYFAFALTWEPIDKKNSTKAAGK